MYRSTVCIIILINSLTNNVRGFNILQYTGTYLILNYKDKKLSHGFILRISKIFWNLNNYTFPTEVYMDLVRKGGSGRQLTTV